MKTHLIPALLILTLAPLALTSCSKDSIAAEATAKAGQPDTGAFLATYRKALAAKDTATLDSYLLTEGSPAEIVDFFKMMRDASAGGETTVELKTPTAEEAAKFNSAMEMPDGKYYKLPLTPTWQLVVTTSTKEGESTSKSTSSLPVAVKDGKLVIPMPVPTGQAAS